MLQKIAWLVALGTGSLLMGKPQAPVKIQATVGASSTSVKLTFDRAADLVNVEAWGVNGLTVYGSKNLATNGSYSAGQTVVFKVDHSASPGHHDLVISVRGQFDGSPASKISSFTIGDKGPVTQQQKTVTDDTGRAVIEMRGHRQ